MKGHYFKRDCKCDEDNCTCEWSFIIDIGLYPQTGKRRQRSGSLFKSKENAEVAAAALLSDVKQGNNIKVSDSIFKDFAKFQRSLEDGIYKQQLILYP